MIQKTIKQPIMEDVLTQTGVREISVWETRDGIEHYNAESAVKHEWGLSVKRKQFALPYYAVSYHFHKKEDLDEFEREHITYYNKKNYDASKISFPCHMVTYYEQDPVDDEGYELVTLIPFEDFRKMIVDEVDNSK